MAVRKTHALRGKAIHVWGRDFASLGIVATDVAEPQIVSKDDKDIRFVWSGLSRP